MSDTFVIAGERVVTPGGVRPAAVVVSDGVIEAVTPWPVRGARGEVRETDAVIMPGVVDTHVHVNEPGRRDWEGFASAGRAAAAGGVTTIVDMPLNASPVTTTVAALEEKQQAADTCVVDHGFWGGVVPGNAGELPRLAEAGVLGFKCFLVPSGIDEFPAVGEAELREAMTVLAALDLPLLVHAEVPGPIDRALATRAAGDDRSYRHYANTRPVAAEVEAVELVVRVAADTGCRAHVVHLSSAAGAGRISEAKRQGVRVSAETCPHYLLFTADDVPDGATEFKAAPPIRTAEDRDALWRGLRTGVIGLVVTDHSPCPPALKQRDTGNFLTAWGGIASLQLGLSALWHGAATRGYGLGDIARWLCEGPARLAGLDRKGAIAPGYDADLVMWDPDATVTVRGADLQHRHPLTPYEGMTLRGVVRETWVRGRRVFDGHAVDAAVRGRPLVGRGA